ncbi:tripartite motif-containing protein 16-like isoform X1 [Denticeps clupeoides]|uniref:tripartite motif-containing protein 16-like isoform X1 n=1 Tax=Denticeps clupeoides TaxID=299321 RepID=UPI0010A3B25F|nr:tripartite motif-containing protein 16-like isoform X1 [Denticeps clupeoides]
MAEAPSKDQDLFTCSVCLDLLKDPVTLSCGHNYCMSCIKNCWDEEDQKGVYSCPQCRHTFTPRPVLFKNPLIAELVENVKKTRLQAAPPALCYAGPGDVECDVCTERKVKAVKSCLVCLVSYCETHFKVHNEVNPGGKHTVTDATGPLQEKICSQHNKLFEIFCRTDHKFICYLCMMDKHRGHDAVSLAAEKMEKLKQLVETQRRSQQRLQEREKKVQELREAVETLKRSAQAAVEDSEKIFTQMIHSIEKMRSEVCKKIRDQEKAELSLAEGHLELLEQEIIDLRRRDAELEQLSHTVDHIHFLQSFLSLCAAPGSKDLPNITVNQSFSFQAVVKSVSALKDKLEDFCKQEEEKISAAVKHVKIEFAEPLTRSNFLQYSCQLTLDLNTANKYLHLSDENRRVTRSDVVQSYPDHPDRFDVWYQVLCREGVSGLCYWEVEWSGRVYVSVSYKGVSRKGAGDNCGFGYNDQSWSLFCSTSGFSFWHNNKQTELTPVTSRIGVYVDHRVGTLSFYSISHTMTLLYRVQTTFTQPLYPGFWVGRTSTVKLL